MQRSPPAVLAGGHEKHFSFLRGGELVSKTSGVREVYFYLWICHLAGKPVLHTDSEEKFLEELDHCKQSAIASGVSPGKALIASDVPAETAAGPQARSCTSQVNVCKTEAGEHLDKETEGDTVNPLQSVRWKTLREDAASTRKVDSQLCYSVKTEDACHQGQRFYLVDQDECFSVKRPDKRHLGTHLSLLHQSDETFLRSLIIPGTSMLIDDFRKFSAEYHRQARAIAPWLPLCLGAIEYVRAQSSSTCDSEDTLRKAGCQTTTSAVQCATSTSSSARPKGEVLMENLLYGMSKPAVLDTKLGTKYYGEVVSAAKREKEAQYARQRGTQEVGMAFGGYCCGSPFDKNIVSVSGGSRAPENFHHPKTVEAFSYWFQSFLMLQGNVDTAIDLGRTFARLISDLIDVRRSMQEKPLMNFFGTSVLLIYDAGAQNVVSLACGGDPASGTKEAMGEPMMMDAQAEGDKVVETKDQNVADETDDTSPNEQRRIDKRDGKPIQISDSGSRGVPKLQPYFTAKDSVDRHVDTEKGGKTSTSDVTARRCKEIASHASCCRNPDVTALRGSEPTPLNAKVRIVDFAHVVVLPQQVDKGFIFGLENLRDALRLATCSLENTKRGQLPAAP